MEPTQTLIPGHANARATGAHAEEHLDDLLAVAARTNPEFAAARLARERDALRTIRANQDRSWGVARCACGAPSGQLALLYKL